MEKIYINKDQLIEILKDYDEDRYESEPLNAISFCDYVFHKYQPERSKREDHTLVYIDRDGNKTPVRDLFNE